MRRLLRVLELEEEHYRAQMEAALADLRQLERALTAAGEQERAGRRLVAGSIATGEIADRVSGIEESRLAGKRGAALKPRIAGAEAVAASRQQKFLEKRVERRQAETVVEKAEAEKVLDDGRRVQRSLDDWFLRQVRQVGRRS
jgi:hypothetical protein